MNKALLGEPGGETFLYRIVLAQILFCKIWASKGRSRFKREGVGLLALSEGFLLG